MNTEKFIQDICDSLDTREPIRLEDIPNIDLYMDQVTTFMNKHLAASKRNEGDKILTKTMINNYAKNDLLPPPVKKRYSREHLLMLVFIYYLKGILSISDIQTLLNPISDEHFSSRNNITLEDIYTEVFSLTKKQSEALKKDIIEKFELSKTTFDSVKNNDFLQIFSFICVLSYDVYMKKQIIEKMLDAFSSEHVRPMKKDTAKEVKKPAAKKAAAKPAPAKKPVAKLAGKAPAKSSAGKNAAAVKNTAARSNAKTAVRKPAAK